MTYPKAFTVEEANALVPLIEEIFFRIDQRQEKAKQHRKKLHILDALWGDEITRGTNPDHDEFVEHTQTIASLMEEITTIARNELVERGLRLPDGFFENGLVDFPTTYKGRWVFLCWQRGEDELRFWHEINAGKRGRQEISAEHIIFMGREDP
jgi:hypothetical protein